jgi:GDP-L-fucose synthase
MKESYGIPFFYGILTNLYGPADKFDQNHGHVIPSLIRKMYQTKYSGQPFRVWGDGSAKRDFMHVQDAARAVIHGMTRLNGSLNISSGKTVSIRYIVEALVEAADFDGEVIWEVDKPVGVPERSVSNSILESSGFECIHDLRAGIAETWQWFVANAESARL